MKEYETQAELSTVIRSGGAKIGRADPMYTLLQCLSLQNVEYRNFKHRLVLFQTVHEELRIMSFSVQNLFNRLFVSVISNNF